MAGDKGHVHIHGSHERGHITRLRCQCDSVRSGNGYGRDLPRGGRGRRTGVTGRRKEAEEIKKHTIFVRRLLSAVRKTPEKEERVMNK